MTNNDYLRSLRYLLNVNDVKIVEIFKLSGISIPLDEVEAYLKNDDDPDFIKCHDDVMAHFLDGMIYFKRGKNESKPAFPFEFPITNNLVLKKVRVAFALKENEMLEILATAGFKVSRGELSALLRKKGQDNYRDCGDQFLRNFFKGLSLKNR